MLNPQEQKLLNLMNYMQVTEITCRSDRLFDVSVKGVDSGYNFSAWLPLAAIHNLVNWCKPEVAYMTDYPRMAHEGDWSGVRDTEPEKIWEIFNKFILPKVS